MKSSRMRAKTDNAKTATKLLVALTGKASPAKAAEGDEPVFAYIASLPQPQRGVAERIDALAAKTFPDLQGAVKWGWRTTAWAGAGLLVRCLRRPCETDAHPRDEDQAGTAGDAGRDGQVHTRRRAGIRGRSRPTPGGVMDEAGRRHALHRGEKAPAQSNRCARGIGFVTSTQPED